MATPAAAREPEMELWIAIGLVFLFAIVFLWRSRRVGTSGKESLV